MKSPLICLLAALVALPLAAQTPAPSSPTNTELHGKWHAIEATSNGEPAPAGMLDKLIIEFNGDTMVIMGAPPLHFKVDITTRPAHIDLMNSAHQTGIYVIDGDTLKLCTGQHGDRPTEFVTKKYTDHTYMLLKRVKE